MSKSTGPKGDNDSKNDKNGSEGSESKGATTGSDSRGGRGDSGASRSNSDNDSDKGNDTGADTNDTGADTSSPQGTPGPAGIATSAMNDAAQAEMAKSADVYGSYVQSVVNAAPVRDAVGVSTTGDYGTVKSAAEMANELSMAQHDQEASTAWNEGRYGDWASNKLGGLVDNVQSFGYEQSREITQAPLDKMADISRNPMARMAAGVLGGPLGIGLTTAIGIADSVADYAQGELTGKKAAYQGIGDVVSSFAPTGVQIAYNAVANPKKAANQAIGMVTKTGNPIADTVLTKTFGYAADNMIDGMSNPLDNTTVMGTKLAQSRTAADNKYAMNTSSRRGGNYNKPQVMSNDAMSPYWYKLMQEQMNKPKYNQSALFLLG